MIAPKLNKSYSAQFKNKIVVVVLVLWLLAICSAQSSTLSQISNVLKMEKRSLESSRRNLASDRSSSDFDKWICDITTNSWDINCCCDDDCNNNLIKKWEKTDFSCKFEGYQNQVLRGSDWYSRDVVSELADLQYGLRIYSNNIQALACILYTRESNVETFVEENFSITTDVKFDSTVLDAENDFSEPLVATSTTPTALYTLGDSVYLSGNTEYKLPTPNSFGIWDETIPVKFLTDRNATTCTKVTTYQDWVTNLDAVAFTNNVFVSADSTTTATINGTYFVADATNVVTSTTTYPAIALSNPSAGTCTCTNVPKELHYTAITSGGNKIDNVTLNGAFVTVTGTCTDILSIDQVYSFVFKESTLSRVQSGSPGYHKGLPVLAGYLNNVTNPNFILAKEQGFPLYGVDTAGTCLTQSTTINPEAYNYYDDPILTFADGAVYGCKLSYTLAELQTFCSGTTNTQITLLNNIVQNLIYVGIYGNSNPHFISDWVEVEYISGSATTATLSGRSCTFNSALSVRFYITKLGTKDNPQYKITRVRIVPERLSWEHTLTDPTKSQSFHALVSVSFHEVPQSSTEFIPKPPNKLPKLSRNVLYPFFIYDG